MKNKRNFTPVHFAAYLGRNKFLELLLKKTENVEQTKLQNIKNLIPFIPKEDGEKDRIIL
jgi:ankyrin repeat protein